MPKTKRPVAAVKPRKAEHDIAVILQDVPPNYDWGWYSREDPRMHIQAVDKLHRLSHYKVWLERRGRRVFEAEPGLPARVLKTLQGAVTRERQRLDTEWAAFMINNGWLKVKLADGIITIYAYPNTPNHFERTIPLREMIRNEEIAAKVTPRQVALNAEYGFLEIYPEKDIAKRMHEPLERNLFVD